MALTERERRILDALERQFEDERHGSGLRRRALADRARGAVARTRRRFRGGGAASTGTGWIALVSGLIVLVVFLPVSVLVSFIGFASMVVGGTVLVPRWRLTWVGTFVRRLRAGLTGEPGAGP